MENLITVIVNDGQTVYYGPTGNKAESGDVIQLDPQDAYDLSNAKVVQILDPTEAARLKNKMKKVPSAMQELEKENQVLKALLKKEEAKKNLEQEHEELKERFAQLEKMLNEKFLSPDVKPKQEEVIEDNSEELNQEPEKEQAEELSDLDIFMKKKGKK